jgi:DNA-binding response OmpR family regulator
LYVLCPPDAKHVLLVEDHAGLLDMLTLLLIADQAFVLSRAEDGEQALEILSAGHVDVMILDLYLPRVSGLEVLRSVRDLRLSTKVIAISAASPTDPLVKTWAGEADYFLPKPIDPDRLVETVRAALGSKVRPQTSEANR